MIKKILEGQLKNDKRIRKKNVVVFDIQTKVINVMTGKYHNNKLNVKQVITEKTPELSIMNGRISNMNSLALSLKDIIEKNNIKEKYAIVNLKSSVIINREMIVPHSLNEESLEQMIQYEMKQFSAISEEEYISQHQILDEFYDDGKKMLKILVTSIERQVVEKYLNLIKEIGLKPYVFDVHFNSIRKFFEVYDKEARQESTVAVIDIGFDSIDVTIIENGKYRMNRTINKGTNSLESVLANDLNLEFTAEDMKKLFKIGEAEAKLVVESAIDLIVSEINDIIRYHITRDSKNTIDNIFITGSISSMDPLVDYITKNIGLDLYEFKIIDKVLVGYDGSYDIPAYINLLGSFVRR